MRVRRREEASRLKCRQGALSRCVFAFEILARRHEQWCRLQPCNGKPFGQYRLGCSANPLPHDVPPNGIVEFLFSITAPSTAGQYPLQWRMNQEGVGRFGDATANTNTRVVLPPLKGVWTEYDALGRVTSISKDTDAGLATTVVAYEPGNRRATTDPRGATTRFQYQAFGSPIQSAVIAISAPEGQFTDIPATDMGARRPLCVGMLLAASSCAELWFTARAEACASRSNRSLAAQ